VASYKEILNRKKKDWKCEGLMDAARAKRGPKIPFSSPLMNWCTYGGIPRFKMIEFFGDQGCGKSTTAVDVCKNSIDIFKKEFEVKAEGLREKVAKKVKTAASELEDLMEQGPQRVLYLDLEHAFDGEWAKQLGIDEVDIDVMQPPNVVAEDVLQTVEEIITTGEVGLIVIDSIPSLVPKAELDKKYGERTVAALAGLLSVFCRKVIPLLTRYKCTLLIINQTRDNMENVYVVKTPGGRAPKFYSSLRVHFRLGSPVDFLGNELPKTLTNEPDGYVITAKIEKQKTAPFDRKQGTYYLMCQSGIRPDFDYANLAIEKYSIILKSGAWFSVCDPETGEVLEENGKPIKLNGKAKVYDYLANNPEYYKKLTDFIMNDILGKSDCNENDYAELPEDNLELFEETEPTVEVQNG